MGFVVGKIAWTVLRPSTLLALLFLAGVLLRIFRGGRAGRWPVGLALAGFLAAATLPLGAWLLAPLENRFPTPDLPARVDGIIVLGGAIQPGLSADRGALALDGKAERLVAFAALARRFPDAKLVFTGGTGSLTDPTQREADWIGAFLDAAGIARSRVIVERESRDTRENAAFSKALAAPGRDQTWLLVTSARHMPRAVGVFRKLDWRVTAYPVDYLTRRHVSFRIDFTLPGGLAALDEAAYEWMGLAYYRMRGRIASFFPGP
ncbi:MAG: YdcF family protein [Rhodospirillaceae bacterium]|nr:YdcF family protein [Rhodospirillaceae bacterium]